MLLSDKVDVCAGSDVIAEGLLHRKPEREGFVEEVGVLVAVARPKVLPQIRWIFAPAVTRRRSWILYLVGMDGIGASVQYRN